MLQYSFTNYLVAIIVALTLGQIGSSTPETPNFVTQVHQVREGERCVLLAGAWLFGRVAWGPGHAVCPAQAISRLTKSVYAYSLQPQSKG